jgi:hypothetical protein
MSRGPRQRYPLHGVFDLPHGDHQILYRRDNRELWDQIAVSLDTAIEPHGVPASRLDLPNRGDEKLRHSETVEHFAHRVDPAPLLANGHSTTGLWCSAT